MKALQVQFEEDWAVDVVVEEGVSIRLVVCCSKDICQGLAAVLDNHALESTAGVRLLHEVVPVAGSSEGMRHQQVWDGAGAGTSEGFAETTR